MPTLPLSLERLDRCWPLLDSDACRALEAEWQQRLPAHTLMERAGKAVFSLSAAIAPHARHVWIACGGGNNGGDGLIAAVHWKKRLEITGGRLTVTWLGEASRLPADARYAWQAAQDAGISFDTSPPSDFDLAIDAIFGLGVHQPVNGYANEWIARIQSATCPVLCVDLPSGLDADRGTWWSAADCLPSSQRHTLHLLALKPGAFTQMGRTAAGHGWFDDLGTLPIGSSSRAPTAWLFGLPGSTASARADTHHLHKGSHGDLIVVGGATQTTGTSMAGAALLAARAGLRAGAGRVYVALLADASHTGAPQTDLHQPELMFRTPAQAIQTAASPQAVCVCGCGAGETIRSWLPTILDESPALVLDADALNAIASDTDLQQQLALRATRKWRTVLTPHPLEAARLLGTTSAAIQADRLLAAQAMATRFACTVALKGSGTVVAEAGGTPSINPTGNGLLATAGTGDVLAGLVGAFLCRRDLTPFQATTMAVYLHGMTASDWPREQMAMTATDVIDSLRLPVSRSG